MFLLQDLTGLQDIDSMMEREEERRRKKKKKKRPNKKSGWGGRKNLPQMLHDKWANRSLQSLDDDDCQELHKLSVNQLILHGNRFTHIPSALSTLSLVVLDVSNNPLKCIPSSIMDLSSLRTLRLRNADIESIPEHFAQRMAALHTLDLGDNEITSTAHLLHMRGLHTLILDGNTSLRECTFVHDTDMSLKVLDLRRCRLKEWPTGLDCLITLEHLTLRCNQLTAPFPPSLARMASLRHLDLADNRLGGTLVNSGFTPRGGVAPGELVLERLPCREVPVPRSLRVLDLSYNFPFPTLPVFPNADSLEDLLFTNNGLAALSHDSLFPLRSTLAVLNVNANRLSCLPAWVATELTALRELHIANNTVDALPDVGALSRLRKFDAKGSILTFRDMSPLIDLEFAHKIDLCNFYETVPQRVTADGIFLGSGASARNFAVLRKLGITHILNASFAVAAHSTDPDSFTYLNMNLKDTPDEAIDRAFPLAHAFINDALAAGGSILIHCQAGVSRSVTLLCSYLMKRDGLSAATALSTIRAVRPHVEPLSHFISRLQIYENVLREEHGGGGGN